ncbi:MAG: hypothetical protein IKR83_04325 [Bacteroidales bacterium]|nr:hypothetical protein [Bacteroidales bacterium]
MKAIANLFCVLVLLTMLPGCRRAPSEGERALIALDSLIATNPDSALAQLLAVDTAALDEPCRAYRALLAAQARYKAYVRATDSTDITRAWRYYRHSGPYDRRIRAMLYRGAVAEELEHPDQAMCHYKQAEQYARPDDHYNRGYALMREGYLYQEQYTTPDSAIAKHHKALTNFVECNNRHYQLICMTELGMVYRLVNKDLAERFARRALELAEEIGDSVKYYDNIECLAGLFCKEKDWVRTKEYALRAINSGRHNTLQSCYYYAAQACLNLGEVNSARMYFNLAPKPSLVRDSILYFRTLSALEQVDQDFKASMEHAEIAGNMASETIWNSSKHDVKGAEQRSEQLQLIGRNGQLGNVAVFLIFIAVAFSGLIAYLLFCRMVSYQQRVSMSVLLREAQGQLRDALAKLEKEQDDTLTSNTANLVGAPQSNPTTSQQEKNLELLELHKNCLATLFNSVIYSGNRGTSVFKYVLDAESTKNGKHVSVNLPETFWNNVERYISFAYPNAMEQIALEGISLTPKEKQLIFLDCLDIPNAAMAVILNYAERSVASTRFKLATRLGCQGKPFDAFMHEMSEKYTIHA